MTCQFLTISNPAYFLIFQTSKIRVYGSSRSKLNNKDPEQNNKSSVKSYSMQSSTLSVFLYKKSAITKCTPTKFIQTNRHAVTLNSRSTNKQVTMSYHTVFPELHSSSLSPKNTTGLNLNHLQSHIMVHAHTLFFGVSSIFFSVI